MLSRALRFLALPAFAAAALFTAACDDGADGAGARNDNLGQSSGNACNAKTACAAGLFCDFGETTTCGENGGSGVCRAKPEACTLECADPGVCGCDGKLHCSACQASSQGVSLAPNASYCQGGPAPTPKGCGVAGGVSCAADEYCDQSKAASCGAAGTCVKKPEACTEECGDPGVCGCDGKLHCTACQAASAGVSLSPDPSFCKGGTTPPSTGCGVPGGATCAADEVCDQSKAASCGAAGTCIKRPEVCDQSCASPMLCGCDGKLYCNPCIANGAGTSVSPDPSFCGGDAPDPQGCGTPGGALCAANEFCDLSPAQACGGKGAGTCKPRPEACTEECASPMLCGCDGKTYCNACSANGAGTSISPDATICAGK